MSADSREAGAAWEAREGPARPPPGSPKACLAAITKNCPELGNQAKGGATWDVLLERFIRGLAEGCLIVERVGFLGQALLTPQARVIGGRGLCTWDAESPPPPLMPATWAPRHPRPGASCVTPSSAFTEGPLLMAESPPGSDPRDGRPGLGEVSVRRPLPGNPLPASVGPGLTHSSGEVRGPWRCLRWPLRPEADAAGPRGVI